MLFHGSNTKMQNGDFLKPNISFDYKPLVYATSDLLYALVRCGKFDITDVAIREEYDGETKPYVLVELRENAFKDIFNTTGYIYCVKEDTFIQKDVEFVSSLPVKVDGYITIKNVYDELKNAGSHIKLIEFKDLENHMEEIGCDLTAYLQRRKERVNKIIKG